MDPCLSINNNYYSSFDKTSLVLPKISGNCEEEIIEIPLPANLEGKYLISECNLIKKVDKTWSQTVEEIPFAPRVSSFVYYSTAVLSSSEVLYSAIASYGIAPKPPLGVNLACIASTLYSLAIIGYRSWQTKKIEKDPYKRLELYLEWIKENPYFLEVFEEINRKEKISFKIISKEEAKNKKILAYESSNAWYDPYLHTITLLKEMESIPYLEAIIFECCNAFQRSRFLEFNAKINWNNIPDRNVYGMLLEKIEYDSFINYYKIVKYGVRQLNWNDSLLNYGNPQNEDIIDFKENYLYQNRLLTEKTISHTEFYRLEWDHIYAPLFFLKHSEKLEKHPELLKFRSSENDCSLLALIILESTKLLKNSDIKTQKKVMIALNAFINRWYIQKQKLSTHYHKKDFEDIMYLFSGCFIFIFNFQKQLSSDLFIEKTTVFLYEDYTDPPVFDLQLGSLDPHIRPYFNSFLKLVKKQIKNLIILNTAYTRYELTRSKEASLLKNEKNIVEYFFCLKLIQLLKVNFFNKKP